MTYWTAFNGFSPPTKIEYPAKIGLTIIVLKRPDCSLHWFSISKCKKNPLHQFSWESKVHYLCAFISKNRNKYSLLLFFSKMWKNITEFSFIFCTIFFFVLDYLVKIITLKKNLKFFMHKLLFWFWKNTLIYSILLSMRSCMYVCVCHFFFW